MSNYSDELVNLTNLLGVIRKTRYALNFTYLISGE